MQNTLKIATRKSPLALWQAEFVKQALLNLYPELTVELVPMVTKGDKILDVPLAKIGGKGLFIKELEHALLTNKADIAVHSTKDLPMLLPQGLSVPIFMKREDPSDAFVSNKYSRIDELPQNAVIGTSSLRRGTQIKAYRPDVQIKDLRGNVGTRLGKLDNDEYDVIILASSGLMRLGLDSRIAHRIPTEVCLPAVGQGALAIEVRSDDEQVLNLLSPLNCPKTHSCISAERAFNKKLEGGCQVPIAGHAVINDNQIHLQGLVANQDGSTLLTASEVADVASNPETLGIKVADELLNQGAKQILDSFYNE